MLNDVPCAGEKSFSATSFELMFSSKEMLNPNWTRLSRVRETLIIWQQRKSMNEEPCLGSWDGKLIPLCNKERDSIPYWTGRGRFRLRVRCTPSTDTRSMNQYPPRLHSLQTHATSFFFLRSRKHKSKMSLAEFFLPFRFQFSANLSCHDLPAHETRWSHSLVFQSKSTVPDGAAETGIGFTCAGTESNLHMYWSTWVDKSLPEV